MGNKKDPAFLFYSKDWLEGTAEMTPEEKGVYIDLLAHQHQKGDLPIETKRLAKLTGLSEPDFLVIWSHLGNKFKPFDTPNGNRLRNKRLTEEVTERSELGRKNRIISALGIAVRTSKANFELKQIAKKGFNVLDFMDIDAPNLTKAVTDWFTVRLASLGDGDGNGDENGNGNEDIINNINNKEKKKKNFLKIEIPENVCYDAEKLLTEDQIHFESCCSAAGKNAEDGKKELHLFHLWMTEKEQYPLGNKAAIAGFERWLLNSKNFKRNNNARSTEKSDGITKQNAGAVDLLKKGKQRFADIAGKPNSQS